MKKTKNEIEQELDRKEFENDIHKDLDLQYRQLSAKQKLEEGANKYVIGALHFFATLIFFETLWWLLSTLAGQLTLGFTFSITGPLTPVIHIAVMTLAVHSAITRKSPIDLFLKLMPNG